VRRPQSLHGRLAILALVLPSVTASIENRDVNSYGFLFGLRITDIVESRVKLFISTIVGEIKIFIICSFFPKDFTNFRFIRHCKDRRF